MEINDIKNHINNKSRLIGVDIGSKRVGLSISDGNRKVATPLKTVNYENIQILADELKKIANENNVHVIIFGNPKNMDGTEGSSSQSVKDKVKLIAEKIKTPLFFWDERLSTVGAFNLSSELDVNVSKRLKNIDEKAKKLEADLNSIFLFIEKLNELETKNVEPLTSIAETTLQLGKDEIKTHNIREQVLKNSPDKNKDFFVVPKVVE